MLHVDLKTIHNWVNQGHVTGRRTQGRHLRFDRIEVVRFMRQYGYPIPESVGSAPPRVVLDVVLGSRPSLKKCLKRGIQLTACDGLFASSLAVAAGEQELVVFDLDKRSVKEASGFIDAVRQWPMSQCLLLLGVGSKPAARKAFIRAGGDAALPSANETDLRASARWLTGGTETQPDKLELPPEDV